LVITIDGTAASGKTSAAERLAAALGFHLLKTGAMYRAAGLLMLDAGIDLSEYHHDASAATAAVAGMVFDMPVGGQVILNGTDFTDRIETKEAGELASVIGLFPEVRAKLVAEQRRIAEGWDIVCEGRDQGTTVFPGADVKFYIDGDVTVRARRRQSQRGGELADIVADLRKRDDRDKNREHGPLYPAPDAVHIDTAKLDMAGILDVMLKAVEAWRAKGK
jgi:cytidylate kinase